MRSRRANISEAVASPEGKGLESRPRQSQSQEDQLGAWLDEARPPSHQGKARKTTDALPPKPELDGLVNIYFRRIHPLLPLLDEDEIQCQISEETMYMPLLQAICPVVSNDRAAESFLRFK